MMVEACLGICVMCRRNSKAKCVVSGEPDAKPRVDVSAAEQVPVIG
jgi:hypothetical protein